MRQNEPGMQNGAAIYSIVIPAHNEEAVIGQTLQMLFSSAKSLDADFEVIVVDDASTDRTASIAAGLGARVVPVNLRKISAVRNAGAREARGDVLIFVDADTLVSPKVLLEVRKALAKGAIGGGARVALEGGVPLWGRILTEILVQAFFRLKLAGGCFMFARRSAFEQVGGFDEEYFASEEVYLSRALKTVGRFVIVPEPVITSGRKFRMFSARQFIRQAMTILRSPESRLRRREDLGMWYAGDRESSP
jgi:glycosyltransferase involved in cell wall biosynthesis